MAVGGGGRGGGFGVCIDLGAGGGAGHQSNALETRAGHFGIKGIRVLPEERLLFLLGDEIRRTHATYPTQHWPRFIRRS